MTFAAHNDRGSASDDAPCGRITEVMARSAVIEGEAEVMRSPERGHRHSTGAIMPTAFCTSRRPNGQRRAVSNATRCDTDT